MEPQCIASITKSGDIRIEVGCFSNDLALLNQQLEIVFRVVQHKIDYFFADWKEQR